MNIPSTPDAFIPCSREELVELCINEGKLTADDAGRFRPFADLLAAYYHFQFHALEERLKRSYAPFNPDADGPLLIAHNSEKRATLEKELVATLEQILRQANYTVLDPIRLHAALAATALLDLKTKVDFDDFEQVLVYHRGHLQLTAHIKKWVWKNEILVDTFARVVLLIKFKQAAYFQAKKRKVAQLPFMPGSINLYLYKNIPHHDLELLFPNIQISMTGLDRMLFLLPAVGAGVSLVIKTLPNLVLIAGILLFFLLGPAFAQRMGVGQAQVYSLMPVLLALYSVGLALSSFAFKQYTGYKNKHLKFQKDVTDTLFFKNLATNASVLHSLVDATEEEESKEAILVYYHLLTHGSALTPAALDALIETWMARKLGCKVDRKSVV